MTISAGTAVFDEDGETFDELLAAADSRMFREKTVSRARSAGRAGVVAAWRAL